MQALGVTWRKFTTKLRHSIPLTNVKKFVKVAFSDKYLLYTNVTISVTLSSLGDILEQRYEVYMQEIEKWDRKRTMHMAFSGLAVGQFSDPLLLPSSLPLAGSSIGIGNGSANTTRAKTGSESENEIGVKVESSIGIRIKSQIGIEIQKMMELFALGPMSSNGIKIARRDKEQNREREQNHN
ncbi:hypothetical protein EVAR_34161_1 [Eumeta japonica]|uniref:Uncharacterized protein n=1 Tax=Eumeta variegata TaxID=151549 RepID=A0A4C1WHY0_EUMVA|nr:hypothetical protein EVAR_34161_1 [Eumeta japonica]